MEATNENDKNFRTRNKPFLYCHNFIATDIRFRHQWLFFDRFRHQEQRPGGRGRGPAAGRHGGCCKSRGHGPYRKPMGSGTRLLQPQSKLHRQRHPRNAPPIPPGRFESSNDLFLIPHFGLNWMLDDVSSLGLTLYGNGGMNTEYQTATFVNFAPPGAPAQFQATSPTGVDLMQLFVGFTYSRKAWERHSFGITPIFAVQSFKAEGLQPFRGVSVSPQNVTNNGRDYSYGGGVRIGWLGEFTDWLTVGASLQSQIYMTKFDKYKGLFAENGNFDIPPVYNVGFTAQLNPQWAFAFEVQGILYEEVKSISNKNNFPVTPGSLGCDDCLGFGWENMTIFKLGLQWDLKPDWTLRLGFSTANQVIPNSQALFNILAPATVTDHIAFGFTKSFGERNELNFAYTHAFNNKVSGTNPNTGTQTGFLEMDQNEFEISWSRKF